MNLEALLALYQGIPSLADLSDRLGSGQLRNVHLQGLTSGAAAFVVSGVFASPSMKAFNHLIILDDAEEAAYFHNTLENLIDGTDLFYFPSSFKLKKDFRLLNASNVMLRTEALTKFATGGNKKVIVTYPEALFEKVVLPKSLTNNIILIKTNDTLDVEGLLELFVLYGFVKADFVYEPGQFALRGGILDIYSYGNDKPYRVELIGNEVDSIRIFDPVTQLSEKRVLQVNIIPNVETQFTTGEKAPILETLPEKLVVWTKDWQIVEDKLLTCEEDLAAFLSDFGKNNATEDDYMDPEEETKILKSVSIDDFTPFATLQRQVGTKPTVEFGTAALLARNGGTEYCFDTKPQPSFNRQFKMLMDDLAARAEEGYAIYIFAEQAKQLERLQSIFTDQEAAFDFVPVALSIHEGFIDHGLKIVCYTDHQIFQRYHKYKVKQAYNKSKAITLKTLRDLQPGDYVTHIDHGVGTYSGLQKLEVNGKTQEAVRIIYKDGDILYVNINSLHKISKYTGKEGTMPKVNKLGSEAWAKLTEKTKAKVKEIAFDLIKLYAERKAQRGFAFAPDNYMQVELEASFMYEDTPDQAKAVADVKKDMESPSPMDRLVCGDVGFGKTEVAIRAAFKAVVDGKQAAVLVPTTILAFQHYKTFKERLKDFPVTVDYINRFKTAKEKKDVLTKLEEGKIDIVVGTHGLLGKEVKFKDLGMMIIDEEQKFGVAHKEKLKTIKTSVDCLTLTATPIPRTLHFSLMGARDLSIINTPPPNRQPIHTEIHSFNDEIIRDAIYFETNRGGQVFFIHNRVQGLGEMAGLIQAQCPDLSIGFAHGQLEGHELEERILDFIDRKYDVLVCTNIVESGVDIPNVNTIIINNAHHFGLSDLHQLRGRVGRSNKKAFCYLLAPSLGTLPNDSRKRLQTLEQFSELGSGFQIAMRDLDIRGAGNLLGGEQSGFMAEIGFEMYQKILEESVRELKRSKFKELFKEEISKQDDFVTDCTIDTDLEILIPDTYVESIAERLSLYSRLDNCTDEAALEAFHKELSDRFGPVPGQVEDLFVTVRCRWAGVALGFEKMSLKENTLRCHFIDKNDSPYFDSPLFNSIKDYMQVGTNKAHFKQTGKNFLLIANDIKGMEALHRFLVRMKEGTVDKLAKETAAV